MEHTSFSHISTSTIIEQNSHHTVYRLDSNDGQGTASVYSVLPGVEVVYVDIQTRVYVPTYSSHNIVEINHCLEGRYECRMKDGCLQYIGEGDMFMHNMHNHSSCIEFPLGYYRGINITIDLGKIPDQLPNNLPDIPIDIYALFKRFFLDDECFLIQAKEELRLLFDGMYSIPIEARKTYYRLKLWEVLIYLYYFDVASEEQKNFYARQHVDTIKQIEKKITEEFQKKFTITELSRMYCISPTTLKATFKGVFGVPISAYMKDFRIRKAASMLRETPISIMNIALSVGYRNQSKFGAAFKEVYQMNPFEYRAKYQSSKGRS
ncbi:AraC family transcriptional regulator [uncultured Brevibacillus sp.]|uniref:helix-turn-helix domain-containing protein n=1 Tax=uncultured Brevibacillus sp. TaxID=169970 RepID=UPI0025964131|nr:AraC family transcriptional regulator [uncultured Brevibacillus sp.]